MALTQDVIREARGAGLRDEIAIGTSNKIYVGGLVAIRRTTGRAVTATAATGRKIGGVCVAFAGAYSQATDNKGGATGNTGGTIRAVIEYGNEFEFDVATAIRTNTSIGLNVFIGADNQVAGTAVGTAGTRIKVGELVKFTNTAKSKAFVAVRRFAADNIAV